MIPKFRVWDTIKKAMSEVEAIVYTEERVYPFYSKVIRRYIPFSEAILMQSTGKMDSTGQVEVYAGDILYYPDQDEDNYGIIKFDEDTLAFVLDNGYERFVYGDYGMGKVIGNIYENLELLEGRICVK
ncbi:YopX family protein [Streptococcus suis]